MQLKNALKMAGMTILILVVLFVGLFIVASNFKTGKQVLNYQTGFGGVMSDSGFNAPSAMKESLALDEMAFAGEMAAGRGAVSSPSPTVEKKVIKTGSLNLKVEKAEAAAEGVTNIAKVNQGEVANSNFYESSRGVKSGYVTIRVPFKNFENAFNEIKKVASQVLSESTNAQDITEEYIDLEARLKNKRAEEQSFVAILNRSGKIEEVLSVTREIARVRGEIEQLEGRLRYLNSQTDLSTITVNLTEDVEITPVNEDWRPWQVVKNSVKELITNGQDFIDGLIRFIVVVLPILLIYIFIIWLIYLVVRKIYRHFKNKI